MNGLLTVCHEAAKIAPYNAMPGCAFAQVELRTKPYLRKGSMREVDRERSFTSFFMYCAISY